MLDFVCKLFLILTFFCVTVHLSMYIVCTLHVYISIKFELFTFFYYSVDVLKNVIFLFITTCKEIYYELYLFSFFNYYYNVMVDTQLLKISYVM